MGLRTVLVFISLVTGTASASAQDVPSDETGDSVAPPEEAARALYAAAKAEYEAGQFEKALAHFRDAYEQSKRPQLLYNVGLAADRLRLNMTALEAFEGYLSALPDAENRIEVENRIKALRQLKERKAAASRAPAPAVVAAAAPVSVPSSARTFDSPARSDHQEASDGGLLSKWWFWAVAGVVVAGATTGIVVATSGDTVGDPVAGPGGVVVQTLRVE